MGKKKRAKLAAQEAAVEARREAAREAARRASADMPLSEQVEFWQAQFFESETENGLLTKELDDVEAVLAQLCVSCKPPCPRFPLAYTTTRDPGDEVWGPPEGERRW